MRVKIILLAYTYNNITYLNFYAIISTYTNTQKFKYYYAIISTSTNTQKFYYYVLIKVQMIMKIYDQSAKISHNLNWSYIPDHPYKI